MRWGGSVLIASTNIIPPRATASMVRTDGGHVSSGISLRMIISSMTACCS